MTANPLHSLEQIESSLWEAADQLRTTVMFTQLRQLRLYNEKLRTARDLLLPKLMNGEISV